MSVAGLLRPGPAPSSRSPDRVKTRLCPPFTPQGAADVAAAALEDTLAAVRARRRRRGGSSSSTATTTPAGFDDPAAARRPDADRLADAFDDCRGTDLPTLLVGMDTPQLTPRLLAAAVDALDAARRRARPRARRRLVGARPAATRRRRCCADVPTSRDDTGARQLDAAARPPAWTRTCCPSCATSTPWPTRVRSPPWHPRGRFAAAVGTLLAG